MQHIIFQSLPTKKSCYKLHRLISYSLCFIISRLNHKIVFFHKKVFTPFHLSENQYFIFKNIGFLFLIEIVTKINNISNEEGFNFNY